MATGAGARDDVFVLWFAGFPKYQHPTVCSLGIMVAAPAKFKTYFYYCICLPEDFVLQKTGCRMNYFPPIWASAFAGAQSANKFASSGRPRISPFAARFYPAPSATAAL
jgi:hypothetical protein